MSKQAGNTGTSKRTVKMDAATIQKAVDAKRAENEAATEPVATTKPQRAPRDTGKQNPEIADAKLKNDAFTVYDDVDVDALTEAAVSAYKEGERSSRREGQMQIANILARYHQDKFAGDANPVNLYKNNKLQVGTVQLIARIIYSVPEKSMDGKKNPLPRNLEMRVRNIAPVIFYAIQERIPLVWCDKEDALLVPTWLATSDASMIEAFKHNPESRALFSKPVALDGREGRSLATILKRCPDPAKEEAHRQRQSGQGATSQEEKTKQALRVGINNAGLARSLVVITDMMSKHAHKPFSDEIVELLAVCVEHVKTRNGSDAMGAAIKAVSSPAKQAAA